MFTFEILAPLFNLEGHNLNTPISGVAVDTRLLKEGDLFFALPGARENGEKYLSVAQEKKACAAVVSENYQTPEEIKIPLLRHKDPLRALQDLAKSRIRKQGNKIIAITGSIGKTTAKEFIYQLIQPYVSCDKSCKNYNGTIGLPLAILNMNPKAEWFVLEMGIDHPFGIDRLIEIAPPTLAALVGLDLVHSEFFESLEEIAQAKSRIFKDPYTFKGYVLSTLPYFEKIKNTGTCPKVTYGKGGQYSSHYMDGYLQVFEHGELKAHFPWSLPAEHNREHILAAIAIARDLGIKWTSIAKQAPQLKLPEHRLQQVKYNGITFIDDSYNACETSIIAALKALPLPRKKGRKIAVLGDVAELGKFSKQVHERLAHETLHQLDTLLCIGKECAPIVQLWKKNKKQVFYFETRESLKKELFENTKEDDVVLLKGSNSHQLWTLLDHLH
jgi:UDP-N-acetylmuramoyl-tripeptide--D-alanyl-D-alanine ligase